MPKSKPSKLPRFESLDELVEFFDTHDMGEYWEGMPKASFEIDLKKNTHFVSIEAGLAERLAQIAKARRMPSEQLVNLWLKEKILEHA